MSTHVTTASLPKSSAIDESRLARIAQWMQRYVDRRRFAGMSVAITHCGRGVFQHSTGVIDVEQPSPWRADTLVRIYSMTKPMVSVALMMLYERGLVHLDEPIDSLLPEFKNLRVLRDGARDVDDLAENTARPTVHQLLTHTAGFTYGFNDDVLARGYRDKKITFDPDSGGLANGVARLAAMPLLFPPGRRWHYSVATDVVGRLVEVLSGQSLDVFLAENLFEPLGMQDTGFSVAANSQDRLATLYRPADNGLAPIERVRDSRFLAGRVSTLSGGGGLISSQADCLQFCQMLLNGGVAGGERVIGARTLDLMRRNHLPTDIAGMGPKSFAETPFDGVGFGLGGWVMLDPARARVSGSAGDFGWGGMASTVYWIDPAESLSVVMLTQLVPSSTYPNRRELRALVYSLLQ